MKAIVNGRIITPEGVTSGVLLFDNDKITKIATEVPEGAEIIDAQGNYVSPGFIDIHIHGGGGGDTLDGRVDSYLMLANSQAEHGTTTLYPTVMTSTPESLYNSVNAYREALKVNDKGSDMPGIHIEGPYFAPTKAGAQDKRYIRSPKKEEYMKILDDCPEVVRWDFAPELADTEEFVKDLEARGVITSIAHTEAEFEDCERVYKHGTKLMTHFFACMSTLHKNGLFRYAGAVEFGYYHDDVYCEIIADGFHVQPAVLKTAIKIKGVDHIVLVTDAMRAAGLPEGTYIFGSLENGYPVTVEGGIAYLQGKAGLASSVATADCLIRTILKNTDCTIVDAVKMAATNPARVMKIADRTGSIEPGKDADIIIFDDSINVKTTIIKGKTVFQLGAA